MSRRRRLPIAFLPLALLPAGCDLPACENRMLTTVMAPDGRRGAAMFIRSCGATAGFTRQISLVRPGETPTGAGNLFIAGGEGRMPLPEWLGPDRLRITHLRGSPPLRRFAEVDGVRIEYRVP